jgi:hypothetical protein
MSPLSSPSTPTSDTNFLRTRPIHQNNNTDRRAAANGSTDPIDRLVSSNIPTDLIQPVSPSSIVRLLSIPN